MKGLFNWAHAYRAMLLPNRLRVAALLPPLLLVSVAAAVAMGVARDPQGERLLLGACIAAAVLCAGLGRLLMHSVLQPLDRALMAMERMAAGELWEAPAGDPRYRMKRLESVLERLRQGLVLLAGQIRQATDEVAQRSADIAGGTGDLSQRTASQAGFLQETAAEMAKITQTVQENAQNADQASRLVLEAASVAHSGGEVVQRVVQTMDAIRDSSGRIADIIGVIDGIAFQTNILALNAAVEAARAGDHGRGFAVVAAEVRQLAQRSASAAKDIKSLIGLSVEKVDSGSTLVTQAGSTMHEIVSSVQRASQIVSDIARACAEQSGGVQSVNRSINEIDETTRQNAALVGQSSASAQALRDQAGQLQRVVSGLRTSAAG